MKSHSKLGSFVIISVPGSPRSSDSTRLLRLGRPRRRRDVAVLSALEAKRGVVDRAQLEEEEEEEHGAGDDVEDAVPDHLARGRDDVRALGQRPADRVREKHEGEEGGREEVALAEGAVRGEGRAGAVEQQDVPVWQ